MAFAENFRRARKAAGLTQAQLAAVLALDRSAIAKYETGAAVPNPRLLPEICRLLNISMDALFADQAETELS